MSTNPFIQQVDYSNIQEVLNFLNQYEESSQFLIGNLRIHGAMLTKHPNSGNFKILFNHENREEGIQGIFCLSRRGNLLAQFNKKLDEESASLILKSCYDEDPAVKLKGFLGEWNSLETIIELYKQHHPNFCPQIDSKEILFRLNLQSFFLAAPCPLVRLLEEEDFKEWLELFESYSKELKLPLNDLSREERKQSFLEHVHNKRIWGLFLATNKKMVSMANLNSSIEDTGQIGGVFTIKEERQKGYSRSTILHLLKDCREIHHHRKNILFTGEEDIPAQKLYESIGYERIGFFSIVI